MKNISLGKTTAVIPARGGSKGVPRKNIRSLAGYPLLAYSIAAAKLSGRIDRVVISTDSEEIAAIGRRYGAEVPFLRPAALAADRSPDRDFVLHALTWFEEQEGTLPEYIVHLRPTTPLRDPKVVDSAIETLMLNHQATALRSAHEAPESPFKWFLRDEKGYFQPLTTNTVIGDVNMPRQLFPVVYVPNGYVDVLRTSFVLQADTIHGSKILGYLSPFGFEVDAPEDFEFLEFQMTKSGAPLLDCLRQHYREEE